MAPAARHLSRLTLFGSGAVESTTAAGTAQQPFAPERLYQLAAYLAVRATWVSRDQLTALLWPDLPSDAARRNLRKLIYRAQRLPWFDAEVRADALRWQVASDLAEFETAVAAAEWARAVERYGGVFLDGMENTASSTFLDWLTFERTRLAAAFRDAAARRCEELRDDAAARADVATRWLQHDPFDEDALTVLVEALRAAGRAAEAARAHQQFVQRLGATLDVAPSARVVALGAASAAPPQVRAPMARPDVHELVGRRAELQTLAGLLERSECRLLTILGPGGIGKSRLARAFSARVADRYPDGVFWIALEDLSEVSQVVWRLAGAAQLDIAATDDPVVPLIEALRVRRALFVLDNCEHLGELPGFAARLLEACGDVQLLATSRARLEVAGEWLLPLTGLPVPDEEENEVEVLRAFDSVRLFEQRATAAMPGFDGARDALEIARLVRTVEGMPLAIELAAAWVRVLKVHEIHAEIGRSLDLLERSASGLPDRHKSVRASFAHSWRLLGGREQETLARLAIFAAPFTRGAAAQVAHAELPVLAALVDRSLLRAADGRFSFHALMHQCAREQLDADPARAAEQAQRHADFFSQMLARRAGSAMTRAAAQAIEDTLADCRAAWLWLVHHATARETPARLAAMTEPLARFFETQGRFDEGLVLLEAAAHGFASSGAAQALPAEVLAWQSVLLTHKGATQASLETALRGLERARASRNRRAMRLCHQVIGYAWWQQGANEMARRSFEKALALAESLDDAAAIAPALQGLAGCARAVGDFAAAIAVYQRSLALYRERGSPQGQAIALESMASVYRSQRDFAQARHCSEACLRLADEHQLRAVRVYALLGLALVEIELREFDAARAHLEQASAADSAVGAGMVAPEVRLVTGRLHVRMGHPERALPFLREGLAMGHARLEEPSQIGAVSCFAEYHDARGERALAAAYWTFVTQQPAADSGDVLDARRGLAALALTPAEAREAEEAARALSLAALRDRLLGGA